MTNIYKSWFYANSGKSPEDFVKQGKDSAVAETLLDVVFYNYNNDVGYDHEYSSVDATDIGIWFDEIATE